MAFYIGKSGLPEMFIVMVVAFDSRPPQPRFCGSSGAFIQASLIVLYVTAWSFAANVARIKNKIESHSDIGK
jgi:hypothetical protein